MTDLVDQMFPPIHRKWTPEFTDFNYWKTPVQDFPLPDLSPPSPALSARSDTSNQSALARLRNFSLVSRQSPRLSPTPAKEDLEMGSSALRQMSSFEKLSNTLGFRQTASMSTGRSTSPASSRSYDSDDEDGDDLELGADGRTRRRRERRRSMTSMPGTLDELQFGTDEDDESPFAGDGEEDEEEGVEEDVDDDDGDDDVGNEAFDEDLLAAEDMKKVPFL
jgi:phosphatidate phosphatase LPIN